VLDTASFTSGFSFSVSCESNWGDEHETLLMECVSSNVSVEREGQWKSKVTVEREGGQLLRLI
jgi:hypothetical protein